jgi:tetratricopeptide (TPR) repeat protein
MQSDKIDLFEILGEFVLRGSYSEAASLLQEIDISTCPNQKSCINILTAIQKQNSADLVQKLIPAIPDSFKNDFLVTLKIADLYTKVGDILNATPYYIKAQQLNPQNAWTYLSLGRILLGKGAYSEALEVLATGLDNATVQASGASVVESLQFAYVRNKCIAERQDIRHKNSIRNRQFFPGRPVENALFVTMVKNEDDIIYECLYSAYRTGFRNFFIANNGSTDRTEAEISRFVEAYETATVVTMNDPVVGYWQDKKTNAFWRFAVEYFAIRGTTIDWVFPVDADELIVQVDQDKDLHRLLYSEAASGMTLLYGIWCTATPEAIHEEWVYPGNIDKSFPVVSGYDFSIETKVAIRASATAKLNMGNHFATGCFGPASAVASLNEHGVFLIHHPMRSRRQFRSKIVNGAKALEAASTLERQQGGHWRSHYNQYKKDGERFIDKCLGDAFSKNKKLSDKFAIHVEPEADIAQ